MRSPVLLSPPVLLWSGCVLVNCARAPALWTVDGSPARTRDGGCSHFYSPRHLTADGHIPVAVNYDSHPEMQELRLCTTRVDGTEKHLSFSDNMFGRINGFNEHGLGVTSSQGSPLSKVRTAVLAYNAVSRILLGRCRTVHEALDSLETLPIAWYSNYLLADFSGAAAQVEIACDKIAVRRFAAHEASRLRATNHYTLPGMAEYQSIRMRQSVWSWRTLSALLAEADSPIDPGNALERPYPERLRFSHYLDGLGTIHSMVIDLDDLTADVCFGGGQRA